MRVLVIGATGLLGRVLLEQWKGDEITRAGSRDADVRDPAQLKRIFERCRPEWTVLAAAYDDVDGCVRDPKRAHQVNCVGAEALTDRHYLRRAETLAAAGPAGS